MTQPLTETEFRALVDLRRAVGPPYAGSHAVLNWRTPDPWVERFAEMMESSKPRSFHSLVWANYSFIQETKIFAPDHPQKYYLAQSTKPHKPLTLLRKQNEHRN